MRMSGYPYMKSASDTAKIIGLTNRTRETKNFKHSVFIASSLLSYSKKVEAFLDFNLFTTYSSILIIHPLYPVAHPRKHLVRDGFERV